MTDVVVVIPTRNEEMNVAKVVTDFRRSLPAARIFVYDNVSTDRTVERARQAGATVRTVRLVGEGNVILQAFAELDGDVFIMVDGDDTYDGDAAPSMVSMVMNEGVDLVVAERVQSVDSGPLRPGHAWGNRAISWLVGRLFKIPGSDVLSGYRAMSRRFVKSFPGTATGFEIEVQMSAHAAIIAAGTGCVQASYRERRQDENNESKLRTYRDGLRILLAIFRSYRQYAPTRFFGSGALVALIAAVTLYVTLPDDVRGDAAPYSLLVAGLVLFSAGVILTAITRVQRQQLRLAYLQYSITDAHEARDVFLHRGDASREN